MNTFKEGDRVSHKTQGEGTIVNPYTGTGRPTIRFDNGSLMMTDDSLLTPIPQTDAVPFKVGDRVIHAQHGAATVVGVEYEYNLINIRPAGHRKTAQVHPISLTLAPDGGKFKIGDRVSHPLHRDGTVEEYSEHSGLYTVGIGANRVYFALEHQLQAPTPEPKFNVQVMFTDGGGLNSYAPMSQQHTEAYLTQLPDWDKVESITIKRVGG